MADSNDSTGPGTTASPATTDRISTRATAESAIRRLIVPRWDRYLRGSSRRSMISNARARGTARGCRLTRLYLQDRPGRKRSCRAENCQRAAASCHPRENRHERENLTRPLQIENEHVRLREEPAGQVDGAHAARDEHLRGTEAREA